MAFHNHSTWQSNRNFVRVTHHLSARQIRNVTEHVLVREVKVEFEPAVNVVEVVVLEVHATALFDVVAHLVDQKVEARLTRCKVVRDRGHVWAPPRTGQHVQKDPVQLSRHLVVVGFPESLGLVIVIVSVIVNASVAAISLGGELPQSQSWFVVRVVSIPVVFAIVVEKVREIVVFAERISKIVHVVFVHGIVLGPVEKVLKDAPAGVLRDAVHVVKKVGLVLEWLEHESDALDVVQDVRQLQLAAIAIAVAVATVAVAAVVGPPVVVLVFVLGGKELKIKDGQVVVARIQKAKGETEGTNQPAVIAPCVIAVPECLRRGSQRGGDRDESEKRGCGDRQ